MSIQLRPHHLLCTLCFQGKGYSSQFVENFQSIADTLQTNEETTISIVNQTDSVCTPCPHRQDALCASETKVQGLDQKHSNALELKAGETLTWLAAKQRIKHNMTLDVFHQICDGCSWKSSNICEQVLTKFLNA